MPCGRLPRLGSCIVASPSSVPRVRIAPILLASSIFAASIASPANARAQDSDARWELEVHVGATSPADDLAGDTLRQFPATDGFRAVGSPTATSLAVSSWFFGEGTTLFNQVNRLTGVNASIVPLDPVLLSGATRLRGGPNVGVTAARWLWPRVAVELHVDYSSTAVVLHNRTLAAVEASSVSFVEAWDRYLQGAVAASGVASDAFVSSHAERGGGHQIFVIGAIKAVVHEGFDSRIYVAGGMGTVRTWSRAPDVTLSGGYQFASAVETSPGHAVLAPFAERDDVRIRVELGKDRKLVGSLRGGFEYYIDPRRGFRLDIALLLSADAVDTILDASPAVVVREPGAAIAGTTSPTIQFSSHPSDVTPSSLSGPPIRSLTTFAGDGLQAQIKIAVGYFVRF